MINTHQFVTIAIIIQILISGFVTAESGLVSDFINNKNNKVMEDGETIKTMGNETSAAQADTGFEKTIGNIITLGKLLLTALLSCLILIPIYSKVQGDTWLLLLASMLTLIQLMFWIYLGILVYDKFKNKKTD